jgi:uncharacterized damage-inducible protein DinB
MRKAGLSDSRALRLMAHTLSAEKLWLERMQQHRQTMPVWPASTIDECAVLIDSLAGSWQAYLDQLPPDDYDREVAYRNSKGEPWSSRVEDVLQHVLFHSAYHRGQIALQMRGDGFDPVLTDYIHAVRQGFVK